MPLPWVSRELYNRVVADLEYERSERKHLLDRLLGVPNPVEALSAVLPDPNSKEAEDLLDPTTGALTPAKLRLMAQDAANRRAGRI